MSSPESFGPFPNPTPKAAGATVVPPTAVPRMEYLRAYNYIFENPNWVMNVMWGFICIISTSIIPVIGQLIFTGYQYEVIEALCLNRGTRYPDFDTNRFGDYLGRAVWPFLVSLIVVLPMILLFYAGMIAVVFGAVAAAQAGGDELGPILGIGIAVVGGLVLMGCMILAGGIMTPMMLRSGLQQDFAAGFDMGWAIGFFKKMWVELFLVSLFLQFSGMVLMFIGFLALCLGMYVAIAIVSLASSHLCYQLYMIYLARGGRPIPMKPKLPPQMMPPAYAPPQY